MTKNKVIRVITKLFLTGYETITIQNIIWKGLRIVLKDMWNLKQIVTSHRGLYCAWLFMQVSSLREKMFFLFIFQPTVYNVCQLAFLIYIKNENFVRENWWIFINCLDSIKFCFLVSEKMYFFIFPNSSVKYLWNIEDYPSRISPHFGLYWSSCEKKKLKHEKLMDIDDTGLKMMKIHVPEPASFGKPISISIHWWKDLRG